jgi:hypothetical protein
MSPLGGAGARDPGVFTINARKCRRQAPWEMPELGIREHPPSMQENVDGGPPGVLTENPGVSTINTRKCRQWPTGSDRESRSAHHQR